MEPPLLALGVVEFGSFSSLRGMSCMDLLLSLLDFVSLDSTPSLRSEARFGTGVFFESLEMASNLSARSFVTLGPTLLISGALKPDFFPSVLGVCSLGFFLLLHGCS